jgi:hypothetical protein
MAQGVLKRKSPDSDGLSRRLADAGSYAIEAAAKDRPFLGGSTIFPRRMLYRYSPPPYEAAKAGTLIQAH